MGAEIKTHSLKQKLNKKQSEQVEKEKACVIESKNTDLQMQLPSLTFIIFGLKVLNRQYLQSAYSKMKRSQQCLDAVPVAEAQRHVRSFIIKRHTAQHFLTGLQLNVFVEKGKQNMKTKIFLQMSKLAFQRLSHLFCSNVLIVCLSLNLVNRWYKLEKLILNFFSFFFFF